MLSSSAFKLIPALLLATIWGAAPALAGSELEQIPLPIEDAPLPLFKRLHVVSGSSGVVAEGSCEDALGAAFSEVRGWATEKGYPHLAGQFEPARRGTDPLTADCEHKKKGPAVSLRLLAVEPGEGPAFPEVDRARLLDLAWLLDGLKGVSIHGVQLYASDGHAFVDVGRESMGGKLNTVQLDRNARGVYALREEVIPWVRSWEPVLRDAPELGGLTREYVVESENFVTGDEGRKEIFRYQIPRTAAMGLVSGELDEQAFVDACLIGYAESKKAALSTIKLDVYGAAR